MPQVYPADRAVAGNFSNKCSEEIYDHYRKCYNEFDFGKSSWNGVNWGHLYNSPFKYFRPESGMMVTIFFPAPIFLAR